MYNIYIGNIEHPERWSLMCSFTKQEHDELFLCINEERLKKDWLFELEDYNETINFTNSEILKLKKEIEYNIENSIYFKRSSIVSCLLKSCDLSLQDDSFQIICVGGE